MTMTTALLLVPTAAMVAWSLRRALRREDDNARIRAEAESAGLVEPASLHPVIDEAQCIGCASCVTACPEKSVLGVIDGSAQLLEPANCIGHGACRTACPVGAITLVFGTESRGVDIPNVAPDFQTNVPGIYIAGELGGMGLVRNAIEQGRQAMDSIRSRPRRDGDPELDVVIVGAGPAGFSASLAAMEHGLRAVTIEQDTLGGTVAHYPRGKVVMTAPVRLPIVGTVRFGETTKEALLAFWQDVEQRTGVRIRYRERMVSIEPLSAGFEVVTTAGRHRTRTVLLAIGRRGTPRRLGAEGEDRPSVVYRLIDPEQYRGRRVLVVGGGDSAIEAAVAVAAEPGTAVTLSYRGDAFGRAKPDNRRRMGEAETAGRLQVLLRSTVKRIEDDHAILEQDGAARQVPADAVVVCAGGILPTPLLLEVGIEVETKHGTA